MRTRRSPPCLQAIALDGTNHLYYSNRSICFAETGKLLEAKEDGQKCIKIAPDFVKGKCTLPFNRTSSRRRVGHSNALAHSCTLWMPFFPFALRCSLR